MNRETPFVPSVNLVITFIITDVEEKIKLPSREKRRFLKKSVFFFTFYCIFGQKRI